MWRCDGGRMRPAVVVAAYVATVLIVASIADRPCEAQYPGNAVNINTNPATAVQLPTFSFFSVGTSVLVPDRGATYLGGIGRASSAANSGGVPVLGKLPFAGRPLTNRAIGHSVGASSVWVTATIHDFEAMDQALLAQPTGRVLSSTAQAAVGQAVSGRILLPRRGDGTTDFEAASAWQLARRPEAGPIGSVAEEEVRREAARRDRQVEAAEFVARAERAEAEGKKNVARIFYEMAGRRAEGELKSLIAARLEALRSDQPTPRVAQVE